MALGVDPVEAGLVQSLARPGGNITGSASTSTLLSAKRLELLHELLPTAKLIGYLSNPTSVYIKYELKAVQDAARAAGLQLLTPQPTSLPDFDAPLQPLPTTA